MSLGPALVRQWLDGVDDDEVWDVVEEMFTAANTGQLTEAVHDTAKFVAVLLRRLHRDYPEIVDIDAELAEWGRKLAVGEPVR